jgi:basic membrane protein A
MFKKLKIIGLSLILSVGVFGCSKTDTSVENDTMKICLILDEGGVNDQSFNQSAWEGALTSKEKYGVEVSYIESKSESEYFQNIETAIDQDNDLIVGVGFKLTDTIEEASKSYPNQKFAIIDGSYENTPSNITSILFDEAGAGYSVGLIASQMTKGTVGFIGGMEIPSVTGFLDGFKLAIEEEAKDIKVLSQYANSFTDSAKGKAIAQQMISQGADIIFTAGGGVNSGVWEACNEAGIKAIGVDMPSSQFAPNTIITSALKNIGTGLEITIKDLTEGKFKGGEATIYDLSSGGVGYEVTEHLSVDFIEYVDSKLESKK